MTATLLLGRRVLIVEDEPLIALMVEEDIRSFGCIEVVAAFSRDDAIAAVRTFGPDVVILDVNLGSTGASFDLADALAEAGIPFIFTSGLLPSDVPERHLERPFLSKPYQPSDLTEAVKAIFV